MKHASDSDIIDHLGGPARVAELLGYADDTGTQRVHNWRSRGIPLKVRVDHPEIFGKLDDEIDDLATVSAVNLLRSSLDLARARLPSALIANLKIPTATLRGLGEFLVMLDGLLEKFPGDVTSTAKPKK